MKRRLRGCALASGLATALTVLALVGSGCGSTKCDFTASCADSAAVPPDSGDDAPVVIPTECDLKKGPKESPACVDDGAGIFVSTTTGKADGAGTKADPLSTIAAGLAKAAASKRPRVYVCEGTYGEPVKITGAVSLYGGFNCQWAHTGVRPKIVAAKSPALEIRDIADAVVIQNLEATASADASIEGATAIGALIVRSRADIRSVVLTVGPGQEGAPGITKSNYSADAATGGAGVASVGGAGGVCTCVDATTSKGGRGADGDGTKISGGSSEPAIVNSNAGSSSTDSCVAGRSGANGAAGAGGEPVSRPGTLLDTGWDASSLGSAGKAGGGAQGGGGGGAKQDFLAAGGGGGCGGCGGAGGSAGGNGGASIGVASVDATVTIDASIVTTGAGGRGGRGGAGQSAQTGAGGGGSAACAGGKGGEGAGGSGGAGGAGGDSIAVAWARGTEPLTTATELKPGGEGQPGDGGGAGPSGATAGNVGKPGNPGKSIATFAAQ